MKIKKIKFFILALVSISMFSINTFSASKSSQTNDWKKVILEPDLDGDGVKDKIEVEYMQSGDSVKMTFTPFVTKQKGKYTKGEKIEKTIKKEDFEWAIKVATDKKKKDFSKVEFFTYKEGICVQCVHIGSYDDEPKTISSMEEYARKKGYIFNITEKTPHHEIYLSDPRKVDVSKMKTIIRYPIKKIK